MDATDTTMPAQFEAEDIIKSHLNELRLMFPDFTPISDFKVDYESNTLHLKGPKTILSMPLNRVMAYFKERDEKA